EHLPETLSSFLASHPLISVDLEERLSYEIADALRSGLGDIGVVSDGADLTGLESLFFRPDPLALIVARGHPFANRRSLSLADVAHCDFVGLVEGSALQDHVSQHARRLGKRLNYRIR